jgi:hypothetical protein
MCSPEEVCGGAFITALICCERNPKRTSLDLLRDGSKSLANYRLSLITCGEPQVKRTGVCSIVCTRQESCQVLDWTAQTPKEDAVQALVVDKILQDLKELPQ